MLRQTETPVHEHYDLLAFDLDGVVYVDSEAVPRAVDSLRAARAAGARLAFVTNNAARTPEAISHHLMELGVPAEPADIVTSAQAAARLLAGRHPQGSPIFVIGGEGLERALVEQGLRPVRTAASVKDPGGDREPVAVVQGYGPTMPWARVVEGAVLVAEGLDWVATNTDSTIPTARGKGPGNGALVDLVARFAARTPDVAGKPAAPLFSETLTRVGGRSPLFIGDRLDTDIAGARAVGWDSLLVMTGVTGLAELVRASPRERPAYIGADLDCLSRAQPQVEVQVQEPGQGHAGGLSVKCAGWSVAVRDWSLSADGDGETSALWRALAVASWRTLDTTGQAVRVDGLDPALLGR